MITTTTTTNKKLSVLNRLNTEQSFSNLFYSFFFLKIALLFSVTMSKTRITGTVEKNHNGGFYHRGDSYPMWKKAEVVDAFFKLWEKEFPARPSYNSVAKITKISHPTVKKFMDEFEEQGFISDPMEEKVLKKVRGSKKVEAENLLRPGEEFYLLCLHAEDPTRPNASYINSLEEEFGTTISSTSLSNWFAHRFDNKGTFRKSSMIPKDKFTDRNWFKYYEFRMFVNVVGDHTLFNFLDEKHFTNHNGQELKARVDPITGILPSIPVDGDFREAHNLMACISVNHRKSNHMFYTFNKEKGTASYFEAFIRAMVEQGFLTHGEVLVMDNASIHVKGDAEGCTNYLWNTEVDGKPLHVLVIFLPTRAPELNPIELIFHILVLRMKSYHYRSIAPIEQKTLDRVKAVLDNIDLNLIRNCAKHCGYNLDE